MRDHRKLRAFQLADELALAVYKETAHFPKHELFGLTLQMRKAAVSAPSNIVEGCARHSEADFLRFIDIAYASARELEYQVSLAVRLDYIPPQRCPHLEGLCDETCRVLNGLLRSYRR